MVLAHVDQGICPAPRFVVARRGDALAALLPFRPGGAWLGAGRRAHAGWTSPYVTNGTPLVAADEMPEAVDALLDGMAASGRPGWWVLPLVSLRARSAHCCAPASPGAAGPRAQCPASSGRCSSAARTTRPTPRISSPGRRKSLRRQRKRLSERGAVAFGSHTGGSGLRQAVTDFLALEARGWKGKQGTALASRAETAAFARALFGEPMRGGASPRADVLTLDGRRSPSAWG